MKDHGYLQNKNSFFFKLSSTARGALILGLLVGAGAFIAGMAQGQFVRTWGSFVFNFMFFLSIAVGGVAFGHMQDVIGATWGRPIKRIHEAFGSFLALATIMLLVFFFCIKARVLNAHEVYNWIAKPDLLEHFHGKNFWLQPGFMLVRDGLAIIGIFALSRWQRRLTTNSDLAHLQGNGKEAAAFADHGKKTLRYWSGPALVAYALLFSLLAFDLTMSLAPTWLSTLWGGWSFAIMMQTMLASLLLFMFALRNSPLGHYIGRQQFHDVGKLLFGFTVFYAYLTYAHVLTYWYTNIPEETSYFMTRMQPQWIKLLLACSIGNFAFPFIVLIPKASKWTAWVAIPVCTVVLISQWFSYLLVVMPELIPTTGFPWIEIGTLCGFAAMFFLSYFRFAQKVPMLSIGDPLLAASLDGHH